MKKEESGLVILDDILAACDVHVSAQIVKTGIKMLIDSGMIVVLSMSSQFTLLQHAGIDAAMHITMEAGRVKNIEKVRFHRSLANVSSNAVDTVDTTDKFEKTSQDKDGSLVIAETRERGRVEHRVVQTYFGAVANGRRYGGYSVFAFVIFLYVVGQSLRLLADLSITWWAEDRYPGTNYMLVAGVLVASSILITIVRSIICVKISTIAAKRVHDKSLKTLMGAPLLFFQQNPLGRLLNRLSSDTARVDIMLPDFAFQFMDNLVILFSAVVISCVAVPWIMLVIAPLSGVLYYVQLIFRQVQRYSD